MPTPAPTGLPTPRPRATMETQEFWDACADDRFLLRRCDDCGGVVWFPRALCPDCGTFNTSWFEASGRGTVYTHTVIRKGRGEWRDAAPYVVAYVELEEGPRVLTNIVDVNPDAVEVGMPVEVVFHDAGDGTALFRFRPAS